MEEMNFPSLAPKQIKVVIEERHYILREASTGAAAQFRNACTQGAKLEQVGGDDTEDAKQVIHLGDVASAEPLLVSLCLHPADKATNYETPLTGAGGIPQCLALSYIRGWPNAVTKRLFRWIKENSDLGEVDKKTKSNKGNTSPGEEGELVSKKETETTMPTSP